MKPKLEAVLNVAVILAALVAGYFVFGRYVAAYRAPHEITARDHLRTMPGLDWKQHPHTLVLALNTRCHFCEQSIPFYQRLADTQALGGNDLGIVAVFPNDPVQVRQFLAEESLQISTLSAVPLEKINVSVTPTLLLVDHNGRVERTWIGMLDSPHQVELLKFVFASASPAQTKN